MLPKGGSESQGAQGFGGLQQAIAEYTESERTQRRKQARLNVLHSLYYTYKLRYHTEPHSVFEMIKGVAYLLEG